MGQSANSAETQSRAAPEPPRGGLALSSLALAGFALDLVLVTPVVWALARADGISLWPANTAASALFLLLPTVIVVSAWAAHRFTIRHAPSFRSHLSRSAVGATLGAVSALALFAVSGGALDEVVMMTPLAGVVMICVLHANYLGAVRSLIRAGVVDRARPSTRI